MSQYRVSVRESGDSLCAVGVLSFGEGLELRATARVSKRAIERMLRRAAQGWGNAPEVGGLSFIKKLSRGAKAIGRKIVQSVALRKVARTITNPAVVAAVAAIPAIGPAVATGLASAGTAYLALRAATASRRGDPARAMALSAQAVKYAQGLGLPKVKFQNAVHYGKKLALNPIALSWLAQGPKGGIKTMLQQAQPVPPGPLFRAVPGVL